MNKKIKIGKFSELLGVTPDLLKFYEENELIKPSISNSGYRSYRLVDAFQMFEYFKMKKWGFSIKELRQVHEAVVKEDTKELFLSKFSALENQIQFDQCLLQTFKRLEKNLKLEKQWFIEYKEDIVFMPHTIDEFLIKEECIISNVQPYLNAMPITSPAMLCSINNNKRTWGFACSKKIADLISLPTKKPVITLPSNRVLVYHRTIDCNIEQENNVDIVLEDIKCILSKHNIEACGNILIEILDSQVNESNLHQTCTVYVEIKG